MRQPSSIVASYDVVSRSCEDSFSGLYREPSL